MVKNAITNGEPLQAAISGLGKKQDGVVPITSEPGHKIRFDNEKVRIYELVLPKGKATLFHEHRADSFGIVIRTTEVTNEPKEGKSATAEIPGGSVNFTSTETGPTAHRVIAKSDTPFHVIAVELLRSSPIGSEDISKRPGWLFRISFENSRGRAYRIALNPGESSGMFTRPAN